MWNVARLGLKFGARLCPQPNPVQIGLSVLAGGPRVVCALPLCQRTGPSPAVAGEVVKQSVVGGEPDTMPRLPGIGSVPALLRGGDWFGTVVFAASGAVTAGTVGMDALGCTLVGSVTALGGGTLRDAIVLQQRPFWVDEWEYLAMAVCTAAATFFLWPLLPEGNLVKGKGGKEGTAMVVGDTLGVAAFSVIGAMNGVRLAVPGIVSILCGMMTATFGGLTRDVLSGLPRSTHGFGRILHSEAEAYASTALVGATAFVLARSAKLGLAYRISVGAGAAFVANSASKIYDVRLPTWKS